MKLSHFIFFLSLFICLLGCKAKMDVELEKSNPLAGTTWELSSGKWLREDTTFTRPTSPYDQAIMIYGKTHWTYVSQDTSLRKFITSMSGTYSVDGDNMTHTLEICGSYEDIGKSFNYKFKIDGNQLILKIKEYRFFGYDWKEAHQVWKRID